MTQQQQGFADGTHPDLRISVEAGARTAAAIKERKGDIWTHWAGGMQRYLDTLNTTTDV